MKYNINFVVDALNVYDNDPQKSLFFWNNPSQKIDLVKHLLLGSVMKEGLHDFEAEMKMKAIMLWFDLHYSDYAWPTHDVHFHTSFAQYVNCPYTCLNEISSNLEKLIKENFCA